MPPIDDLLECLGGLLLEATGQTAAEMALEKAFESHDDRTEDDPPASDSDAADQPGPAPLDSPS